MGVLANGVSLQSHLSLPKVFSFPGGRRSRRSSFKANANTILSWQWHRLISLYSSSSMSVNYSETNPWQLQLQAGRARPSRLVTSVQSEPFTQAESSERTSPDEVKKEIQRCYELVHKLGRGVVYLGSSRVKENHPHYLQALELAREAAKLLECTTWSGVGPGLMDAVTRGALLANTPVGGFKIHKEPGGNWTPSNFHPYLPPHTYHTCRFFSARKHGLVDAAVRNDLNERTAVVAFPGGIGTLDELFEILGLIQLKRIGSKLPVPLLLLNYDDYYSKLMEFMGACEEWGTLARGEMTSLLKVFSCNSEALDYLADFYGIPPSKRTYVAAVTKCVNEDVVPYA